MIPSVKSFKPFKGLYKAVPNFYPALSEAHLLDTTTLIGQTGELVHLHENGSAFKIKGILNLNDFGFIGKVLEKQVKCTPVFLNKLYLG